MGLLYDLAPDKSTGYPQCLGTKIQGSHLFQGWLVCSTLIIKGSYYICMKAKCLWPLIHYLQMSQKFAIFILTHYLLYRIPLGYYLTFLWITLKNIGITKIMLWNCWECRWRYLDWAMSWTQALMEHFWEKLPSNWITVLLYVQEGKCVWQGLDDKLSLSGVERGLANSICVIWV